MRIVKFIIGALFIIAALGMFTKNEIFAGLISAILGAVILPPVSEKIKEKFSRYAHHSDGSDSLPSNLSGINVALFKKVLPGTELPDDDAEDDGVVMSVPAFAVLSVCCVNLSVSSP